MANSTSEKFETLKNHLKSQLKENATLEKFISQAKESVAVSANLANHTLVASLEKLGFAPRKELEALQAEVQDLSERLDNLTSEVRSAGGAAVARDKPKAKTARETKV